VEAYREAWRRAPVGLTMRDPDTGAFVDVNARYGDLLGYTRAELLEGDVHANVEPYTPERARDLVRKTLAEGPQTFEWLG